LLDDNTTSALKSSNCILVSDNVHVDTVDSVHDEVSKLPLKKESQLFFVYHSLFLKNSSILSFDKIKSKSLFDAS
jgi:hypothetical protein